MAEYDQDIKWVADKFGNRLAAELELMSTIVYVSEEEGVADRGGLIERVKSVKPHFTVQQIERQVGWLDSERLLG